jgi:hypothetical protein
LATWGIQKLYSVEKIGDYNFILELTMKEEKKRVLEGGPWRHKGDALIMVHYDWLARPLEVHIDDISLWVQFYDLPPIMMKEGFAKQLGEQSGRIEYPHTKPLVPSLKVKIKGRGTMLINLRYENVPHFCFTCGRLGHAALNCEEDGSNEGSIKFGEELRASPPKRVCEISIKHVAPRVAKPLFQAGMHNIKSALSGSHAGSASWGYQQEHDRYQREHDALGGSARENNILSDEFKESVKSM